MRVLLFLGCRARYCVRRWTEADRTGVTSVTEYEIRPTEYDRRVGRIGATPALSETELTSQLADLVARAPSLPDLFAHRLAAVAAVHWRSAGRTLPTALLEEERFATVVELAAPLLLGRIVDAYRGP